ncbi:MAG: hypothetical protein GY874_15370 [Desulfobacteraceae bacterium]|nr:hypothetical protein [Desulfobacteraceae bacterium]
MTEKVYAYFPGCSLATTARENSQALIHLCRQLGVRLVELDDWNCCGSSSAHSIDATVADKLAMRNLDITPANTALLVACPSCNLRLRYAREKLRTSKEARRKYKSWFGRSPARSIKITTFIELLGKTDLSSIAPKKNNRLKGLKFAPYYGCMLARPPLMHREKNYHGLMERFLAKFGASPIKWSHGNRCCGTFLSVVRPDVVSSMVNSIMNDAAQWGAECLVTACAMCHLNLEIRCNPDTSMPIFHFAELLAVVIDETNSNGFFRKHLIDPRPLLKSRQLIP